MWSTNSAGGRDKNDCEPLLKRSDLNANVDWRLTRISVIAKLAYALPGIPVLAAFVFNSVYQTKFYVDDLGVAPMRFALANAIVRAFDLFFYPMIGWFIDNFRLKDGPFSGRRRPFFVLASPLVALSFSMIYSPPPNLGVVGILVWFCLWSLIYGIIPLALAWMALGAEVTLDDDQRGGVFAYRQVTSNIGRAAGVIAPAVLITYFQSDHGVSFAAFAIGVALLTVLFFWSLAAMTR